MMSAEQHAARQVLIAEARSWIGTPFRDHGTTKGKEGSIDCAQSLILWFDATGLVSRFDPGPYAARWFLHQDEERYLEWLRHYGDEIDTPQMGDVIIVQFGRCFSHAGIIVDDNYLIHAYFKERQCTLSERWLTELRFITKDKPRPTKYFDVISKQLRLKGLS